MNRRKLQLLILTAALPLQLAGCDAEQAAQPEKSPAIPITDNVSSKDTVAAQGREYIFQDSSTALLTEANLSNIDSRMLELARNEIFARHGLVFKRADLNAFFASKRWYKPDAEYKSGLSEIESKNIKLIQQHEKLLAANKLTREWDVDYHVLGYPQVKGTKRLQDAYVDLDGDGTVEHIQMTLSKHNEEDDEWVLQVNGTSVKFVLSNYVPRPYFKIVDADIQDPYFELALEDVNISAQRYTNYYYYNGKKLISMGALDGHTGNAQAMDGQGVTVSPRQAYDFQCWFYLEKYKLDSNHLWKEAPADFYPMEPPTPWVAKVRFPMYQTSGSQEILKWVEPGETVYFLGGDTEKYGKIKTKSGATGWIRLENDKLSGTDTDINDCFDGRLLYG
ncbi:YARHG domain-containing protein [Paenibacillus sp. HW567]|uniref:YARHG domain-containing protein n=1 Tax=Paenibacillus sp. HW567 TaxID=1034769 RepID=UPI0003780000|nr:YARHG domain-containing protein [Paenibacillus sp. HW567]